MTLRQHLDSAGSVLQIWRSYTDEEDWPAVGVSLDSDVSDEDRSWTEDLLTAVARAHPEAVLPTVDDVVAIAEVAYRSVPRGEDQLWTGLLFGGVARLLVDRWGGILEQDRGGWHVFTTELGWISL